MTSLVRGPVSGAVADSAGLRGPAGGSSLSPLCAKGGPGRPVAELPVLAEIAGAAARAPRESERGSLGEATRSAEGRAVAGAHPFCV